MRWLRHDAKPAGLEISKVGFPSDGGVVLDYDTF